MTAVVTPPDAEAPAATTPPARAGRLRRAASLPRRLAAPLVYLALAVFAHLPAFRSLSTMTPCACRDAPQTDWYLAWTPHAILSGRPLLTSDHLNVPDGVNLMWNTLLPLPGLLAAPVTLTVGVLASHTLLAVLAFFSTATSMWWVAGRWVQWPWARFAAGLLYGFSPYMVAKGTGHLNLSLMLWPPLILLLSHEILVRQRRRAAMAGTALGLVAFAQLMTTTEVLASTFVMAVVGLVVLVVQHRRAVPGRARHAAVGLGTAAGVLTALSAGPLVVQFTGPQRVTAPVQDASPYAADLLGMVVPTIHQVLGTDITLLWGGNDAENGSYLGLPLLVLLIVLAVRHRRVGLVRWASAVAFVAWVLSLGEQLHVYGTRTDLAMPFQVLAHIPVLHNMAAVRFAHYVVLCAALVLAVGLDRMHRAGAFAPGRRRVLAGVAVVLCVVPLLPRWPYAHVDAGTPEYFTSGAVQRVPQDSVALTYPVPRFPGSAPMLWQAEAGFRYKTPGGYVITPREDGSGTFRGGITAWERLVIRAGAGAELDPPPSGLALLRTEMRELGVDSILVADVRGADEVVRLVERLLARPADEVTGGVTAWYDVRPTGPRTGILPEQLAARRLAEQQLAADREAAAAVRSARLGVRSPRASEGPGR